MEKSNVNPSSPPLPDSSALPSSSTDTGFSLTALFNELTSSPLNLCLTLICAYLVYKLFRKSKNDDEDVERFKLPEPLPKHDMTLDELKNYDGKGEDKRVCIGVNGLVYDCTKGRQFYGPGGPYAAFAGRDATRALANFDVNAIKETWDDTSDLTPSEMSSVQEWQEQFSERYDLVGKLVKELPVKEDKDEKEEEKSSEQSDHVKND